MKLYTYFRSSAAYRVRIALALKAIAYEAVPVHLLRGGGEQLADAYRQVNPSALVPTLEDDNGVVIGQSLAILEYLEETRLATPLLPADAAGRAHVRALALTLVADSHPLGNLRVLKYVKGELGQSEDTKLAWQRHWLHAGLATFEAMLARAGSSGTYCHGDQPTLADCCLVPHLFSARRFDVDLAPFPALVRIDAACAQLPAFQVAHPSRQPDAE